MDGMASLFDAARACLDAGSVDDKPAMTLAAAEAFAAGALVMPANAAAPAPIRMPGRPATPRLVHPRDLPRRGFGSNEGRAAFIHAVAHIEFNAINLALDAVWRFPGMPPDYYLDWLRIAGEEALHYTMLAGHLAALGHRYGDFDAHDGLWTMTERTRGDILARMALVPRTLEARGLDATPPMQERLRRAGDLAAVAILDRILTDEVGHVAIGNRWYRWLCERRGLDPVALYPALAIRYQAPRPRPPFNVPARRAAGFTEPEIEALAAGFAPPAAPG